MIKDKQSKCAGFAAGGIQISVFFYCPGKMRCTQHRCVTPLYVIPMWIFDCVLGNKADILAMFKLPRPGKAHYSLSSGITCLQIKLITQFI